MEQRREPRHPFFATVELLDAESEARIQARTGDLSLHGCYVNTMNPFPVASKVRVIITQTGETFTALGTVAHSQLNMGMGVSFTEVAQDQREILLKWLAKLHG